MSQAGSLYQRADGYWVASVTVGKKRVVKYGKTKREAQTKLHELVTASQAGTLTGPSRTTLRELVETWLANRGMDRRPTSVQSYAFQLHALRCSDT